MKDKDTKDTKETQPNNKKTKAKHTGRIITWIVTLVLAFLVAFTAIKSYNWTTRRTRTGDYWKGVTYLANSATGNFWDSNLDDIDDDFDQIKNDGFNSIVLLIPWREFQPDVNSTDYNTNALNKLDYICQKAGAHDLGVVLRLGYFWDYYDSSSEDLYNRFQKALYDKDMQNAWLGYAKTIYSTASKYDNFLGGFMCWEDFWNFVDKGASFNGDSDESRAFAKDTGFSSYMVKNHKELLEGIYGKSSVDDIYIPSSDAYGYEYFYEYVDTMLENLLTTTQEKSFPNLSLEVRSDDDYIINAQGQKRYYSHKSTYAASDSTYTSMVYGIPMAMHNVGEEVSWFRAFYKTWQTMGKVKAGANSKFIFVDQFLFYDNSPGFEHNAKLKEKDINTYLKVAALPLIRFTRGYAIWTYKDYKMNAVANSEFAKGMSSWVIDGTAAVTKHNGSNACKLDAGSSITQEQFTGLDPDRGKFKLNMDIALAEAKAATVTVSVPGESQKIYADGDGSYTITLENSDIEDLTISTDAGVYLDNINLYNWIQKGKLYDLDGNEEKCTHSIRELNKNVF